MKIKNFTIGVIAGVILTIIFFKGCTEDVTMPENVALIKGVEVREFENTKKIDSLKSVVKDREKHISWLNLNDKAADNTISTLRQNIQIMAKNEIVKEKEWEPQNEFETPTEQLYDQIEQLNIETDKKDSIFEETKNTLSKIITLKDTMIYRQSFFYSQLRASFDTVANENKHLTNFVKSQNKKIRNKKLENIIWKGATMALAGALIYKTVK